MGKFLLGHRKWFVSLLTQDGVNKLIRVVAEDGVYVDHLAVGCQDERDRLLLGDRSLEEILH